MKSFKSHDADFSAFAIGEAVPTLTSSSLPHHLDKQNKQYQQSALLPAIAEDQWAKTNANFTCGIHHYRNCSVVLVNEHKVNIGRQDYGSAYEDQYGSDEKNRPGPYLVWSGQRASDEQNAVHAPFTNENHEVHMFIRSSSGSPFYYWGRLTKARLLRTGAPPWFIFTIQSYKMLYDMGFPGSKKGGKKKRASVKEEEVIEEVKKEETPAKPVKTEKEEPATSAGARARKRPAEASSSRALAAKNARSEGTSPDADRANRSRTAAVALSVGDRVKGSYTTEPIAGKWPAKVTKVYASSGHVDLKYDDGEDGVNVPPFYVERLMAELSSDPVQPRAAAAAAARPPAEERLAVVPPPPASSPVAVPAPATPVAPRSSARLTENRITQLAGQEDCVVCLDRKRSHLFTPCGHRCVCKDCAQGVMGDKRVCPLCMQPAEAVVMVWL